MSNEIDKIIAPAMEYLHKEQQQYDVPNTLYQYSDLAALKGVAANDVLWATHFRYLNDRKEFYLGLDLAINFAKDALQKYSCVFVLEFLEEMSSVREESGKYGLLPLHDTDVYSISFSKERDLLSQWRGYGKKYKSVCMGFQTSKLKVDRIVGKVPYLLRKVVYDREKQKSLINNYLTIVCDAIETDSNFLKGNPGIFIELKRSLWTGLISLILSFKEECWKEEEEWRVIMIPNDLPVKFKECEHELVPFIEVPIFSECAFRAFDEVILPRTDDFVLYKKSLRMFFEGVRKQKGGVFPDIHESDISIVY